MKLAAKCVLAVVVMTICLDLGSGRPEAKATIPVTDVEGAADTSVLKRYEGSYIISFDKSSYTEFSVPLSPLERSADPNERDEMNNGVYRPQQKKDLEGALTRLVYVLPEQRSPLEVLRNYEDDITAQGGRVLFSCKKQDCGGDPEKAISGGGGKMSLMQYFLYESQIKEGLYSNTYCALTSDIDDQRFLSAELPQGDSTAYVTVHTFKVLEDRPDCKALNGRTVALVHVLQTTEREKKMVVVNAATMAEKLTSEGSISLYGILFDFDKSDLKPESRPAIDEIAKLLKSDASLTIIVVGHTDNKGSYDYNIDLSSRRAGAVRSELVSAYGIEPARLIAAGAGMMAPVASNDSEAGRAKNRRVELVKRN